MPLGVILVRSALVRRRQVWYCGFRCGLVRHDLIWVAWDLVGSGLFGPCRVWFARVILLGIVRCEFGLVWPGQVLSCAAGTAGVSRFGPVCD